MATIRELLVKLGVEVTGEEQLKQLNTGLTQARNTFLAVSAASAAAIAGLFETTRAFAAAGDEASKTAQQLGLTAEEYQELVFATERSGASAEQLRVALSTLTRQAFDAARGAGEGRVAFEQLGISVTDANGDLRSSADLFAEAAQRISELDSEAEQLALAQKLFGEGGGALIPLLQQGAAGIDELRARARELGFVIDDEAAAAAEGFADSLLDTQLSFAGLRNTIGSAFLPTFQRLIDGFGSAVRAVTPYIDATLDLIDNTIGLDAIVGGLAATFAAFGALAAGLTAIIGLGGLAGALSAIFGFISSIVAGVGAIGAPLAFITGLISSITAIGALGPVLAVVAAAAGVVVAAILSIVAALGIAGTAITANLLILQDLYVLFTGGQSAIGTFIQSFAEADGVLGSIARVLIDLGQLFGALFELGSSVATLFSIVVTPVLGALASQFQTAANAILTLLGLFGQLVGIPIADFFEGTGTAIDGVTAFVQFLTQTVDSLIASLASGAEALSSFGGLASTVSAAASQVFSSTTNNLSLEVNSPITTTGSPDATGAAVQGAVSNGYQAAYNAVLGGRL